jgi:CHASE2 domain-containing sensor protein
VTLDIARVKRRRTIIMVVNGAAAALALASVVGWFHFGQGWALIPFVGALLGGFGAQIWFIAGLRGPGKGV